MTAPARIRARRLSSLDRESLVRFAVDVLATLEVHEDWDADTFGQIDQLAKDCGLSMEGPGGYFAVATRFRDAAGLPPEPANRDDED